MEDGDGSEGEEGSYEDASESEAEAGEDRRIGMKGAKKKNPNMIRKNHVKKASQKSAIKSKNWIMKKKDRQRKQGKTVRRDSKYSGTKRSGKFN